MTKLIRTEPIIDWASLRVVARREIRKLKLKTKNDCETLLRNEFGENFECRIKVAGRAARYLGVTDRLDSDEIEGIRLGDCPAVIREFLSYARERTGYIHETPLSSLPA